MKTLLLLCVIPYQLFSCQHCDEIIDAKIFWVNNVLYIEADGHLYYASGIQHSINCKCEDI